VWHNFLRFSPFFFHCSSLSRVGLLDHVGYFAGGVIDTNLQRSAVSPLITKLAILLEYIIEFESIFEKALTRVSGAHIELAEEKNFGRKSHDTVP
jgi:hypothetical protein